MACTVLLSRQHAHHAGYSTATATGNAFMRCSISAMGKSGICTQAGQVFKSVASALCYTSVKTCALHMQVARSDAKNSGSSKVCNLDTAQFMSIAVHHIVMLTPRPVHLQALCQRATPPRGRPPASRRSHQPRQGLHAHRSRRRSCH